MSERIQVSLFSISAPSAEQLLRRSHTSPVAQGLDEGLGLAFVHLDVDLGIFVLLVPDALEAAAVAQQVEGQAESHHAQRQQTHVHLKGAPGSVWYRCMRLKYIPSTLISHP